MPFSAAPLTMIFIIIRTSPLCSFYSKHIPYIINLTGILRRFFLQGNQHSLRISFSGE